MITAVLPVWNTDPGELREAISSLRAARIVSQIILVDDHSDRLDTQHELQAQSEQGASVILSRAYRNTPGARATGVYAARTEFVLNMDSDDTLKNVGFNPHELAPINFAAQNTPYDLPTALWGYLDDHGALQWGSVIETGLARSVAAETELLHEDFAWACRLLMTAWRDRLPVRKNSGIAYHWRTCRNRDTVTSRSWKIDAGPLRLAHFNHALDHVGLCPKDRAFVTWWRSRKFRPEPRVSHLPAPPNARVDVHVLSYLSNLDWLEQCLQSLVNEPCATHVVMGGFHGSIGAARAYAFTLGTAEYVCFMDDDDYAIPGIMQQCIDHLDTHPECIGVYTDTEHLHPNGHRSVERKGRPWRPLRQLLYCPEVTHLKVMRRSAVMPYLGELAKWPTWEEYVLCGLMTERGIWHHLPVVGAVKRAKPASQSSMRLATGPLWKKAVAKVTPALMRAQR